jgi:hypothetical protein
MKVFTYLAVILALITQSAFARDTQVRGYYRKNGTYVQPHVRSAPDKVKWNNYGSGSGTGYQPVRQRDRDRDGTPNYLDTDDNNNGVHDDHDSGY